VIILQKEEGGAAALHGGDLGGPNWTWVQTAVQQREAENWALGGLSGTGLDSFFLFLFFPSSLAGLILW
jgi:hypothetical protein